MQNFYESQNGKILTADIADGTKKIDFVILVQDQK